MSGLAGESHRPVAAVAGAGDLASQLTPSPQGKTPGRRPRRSARKPSQDELFRAWLGTKGYKPNTVNQYAFYAKRIERWLSENLRPEIAECTTADLQAFVNTFRPSATESRKTARNSAAAFWRFLRRTEEDQPFSRPPRPAKQNPLANPALGVLVSNKPARRWNTPNYYSPFAQYLRRRDFSERTLRAYVGCVHRIERWLKANARPQLKSAPWVDIRECGDSFPYTHACRSQLRSAIGGYWKFLDRHDPPLWAIRWVKRPRMVCRALEDDELERVIKVAREWPDPQVWGMVALMYYAALRAGETVSRRWDDFDLENRTLRLVGKGRQEAVIELSEEIVGALARLDRSSAWVFPGKYAGRPVAYATLAARVNEVSEAAGLVSKLTAHRIRHTALAVANDVTKNLRAVQDFARHADPRTTAGYTRSARQARLDILAALEGRGRVEDRDQHGLDLDDP